jgi:hypothetical protein
MKWRKYLPLVALAFIPGGMIILFAWATVLAIRYGDRLAEEYRKGFAEYCKKLDQEEGKP